MDVVWPGRVSGLQGQCFAVPLNGADSLRRPTRGTFCADSAPLATVSAESAGSHLRSSPFSAASQANPVLPPLWYDRAFRAWRALVRRNGLHPLCAYLKCGPRRKQPIADPAQGPQGERIFDRHESRTRLPFLEKNPKVRQDSRPRDGGHNTGTLVRRAQRSRAGNPTAGSSRSGTPSAGNGTAGCAKTKAGTPSADSIECPGA